MNWRPLPLDYVLGLKKPARVKVFVLILLWVLIIVGSMWLTMSNLPANWAAGKGGNRQLLQLFILNPPMLIGLVMLFWVGFDWAFIPVMLSMFVIGLFSGLHFMWAILFSLSFVFAISIYAITYQSVDFSYDLRRINSLVVFIITSFVAATASSLGAFIWSFSNNFTAFETATLWNGWWAGSFLQSVLIVGPILFIFSRKVEQLKDRNIVVPERKKTSLRWVYSSILAVTVMISVFIYSGHYLGKKQVSEILIRVGKISEETLLVSINSFSTITWVSIWVTLCVGGAAVLLLGSWNKELQIKVDEKTESLRESLAEKSILLKEIHHRVKNNLAVITALLELQYLNATGKDVQHILSDSITRVKSMAFVHETLYNSESFSEVDLKNYVERLCDSIQSVFNTEDKEIELIVISTGYNADMEKAIPIGLLLNELLVNAYKHAFANRDKGKIQVELHAQDNILSLTVQDNGVGFTDNARVKDGREHLGMTIIDTLVNQLNATMKQHSVPGLTAFHFTMNLDDTP